MLRKLRKSQFDERTQQLSGNSFIRSTCEEAIGNRRRWRIQRVSGGFTDHADLGEKGVVFDEKGGFQG
ncbi:MAG: hypothetical protein ABR907_12675 [Terracidiphilus sp.]|jgi:hypothetical protein